MSAEVDVGVEGEDLTDLTAGELVEVGVFGAEFGGFEEFALSEVFEFAVEAFDGGEVVGVVVAGEEAAREVFFAR